ncbi:MAG: hypothetical protein AB7I18_03990 [Candidatus Berkiella sp.]
MKILKTTQCHFVHGAWNAPKDYDFDISTAGLSANCIKALQYWAALPGAQREENMGVFTDYCSYRERVLLSSRWDAAVLKAFGRLP